MRRMLRIILSFILLLLILIVIIVAGLIAFVNPNQLKPLITAEVMKKTGYQLNIMGDLTWSFYPYLGIQADRMQLRAPHQSANFLDLTHVTLSTKLMGFIHDYHQVIAEIHIDHVLLGKLNLQTVDATLHWQDQVLTLSPVTAQLYGGALIGKIRGKDLKQALHWMWEVQLKNININDLLKDINNQPTKLTLTGLGQINFKGETQGRGKQAIIQNMNAILSIDLQKGVLTGIDLNYLIKKVETVVREKQFIFNKNDFALLSSKTLFERCIGSAIISHGIAETNDLLLASSAFTAKARGKFDLLNQYIDYQMQVLPAQTSHLSWAVPVLISGNLQHPHIRLDLVTLNTLIARDQLERAKVKIEEQVKKLPEQTQKFIHRLLSH